MEEGIVAAPQPGGVGNPSPPTKPVPSSPLRRATACTPYLNSPSAPDSARASSSACVGKTSTSTLAPPASAALQRTRTGGLTTLPTKIISSERRIALPGACVASLREHRDRQAREKQQAGAQWVDNGFVFTRPDGHPIEPATLTRHFKAMLRRSRVRAIRFHDLRHSTATLLLEQGIELVVIKELLGHAHIGVTATVYAHVRLCLQRDAIDVLSRTLGKPPETAAEPDDGDDPPLGAASVR